MAIHVTRRYNPEELSLIIRDLTSNLMITTGKIPKTGRKRVVALLSYALDICGASGYDVE
jgi:hypothetical protein